MFDGNLRITGLYRNQWYKIDHPFSTMQLSADGKTRFLGRMIGIGGVFLHDQSSGNYLNTDRFMLSLSHSFFYQNHQFVVGLQPGFTLKSFDANNSTFGSQFDPNSQQFDPSLPSNEEGLSDKMNYFDMNAGFYWRSKLKNKVPSAGISLQHINKPTESFFNNSDQNRLAITYTIHGSILVPLSETIDIEPIAYYTTNLKVSEMLLGGTIGFTPQFLQQSIQKVSIYSTVRVNPFTNVDAFILGGSVKILNFDVGMSYDITISELRNATNYQGAYEISLIYITNRKKQSTSAEPCFMM